MHMVSESNGCDVATGSLTEIPVRVTVMVLPLKSSFKYRRKVKRDHRSPNASYL